jgi:hypothetical protein
MFPAPDLPGASKFMMSAYQYSLFVKDKKLALLQLCLSTAVFFKNVINRSFFTAL